MVVCVLMTLPAAGVVALGTPAGAVTPTNCSADAAAGATGWITEGFPADPDGASDATARQSLETGVTNAQAIASTNGSLFPATPSLTILMEVDNPGLTFESGGYVPSTGPTDLSVDTSANGEGVILSASAASGWCWAVLTNESPQFGAGTTLSGESFQPWPSGATAPGTWFTAYDLGPPADTPEAPAAAALPIAAIGLAGAVVLARRRTLLPGRGGGPADSFDDRSG